MINFSKVAKQIGLGRPIILEAVSFVIDKLAEEETIKEEPMVDGEFVPAAAPQKQQRRETPPVRRVAPPVRRSPAAPVRRGADNNIDIPEGRFSRPARDGSQGGLGFWAEKVITQHVLPKFKKGGIFKNIDVGSKGHNFGIKTDIYHDKGGDPSENTAYSVKSKVDNDFPQKVHQTGVDSRGAISKMNLQSADRQVRDAFDMYLGANGTFTSSADMKENNPELYDALKSHLSRNKLNVFNNLVRQQGSPFFGDAYGSHDPRMIDALISHRVTGDNNSGPIDIRQLEGNVTEENFEDLQWFDDGKRFYLGEEENAPTDMRMLDLWPIDKEGSRWSNREDDGGPRPGQRGFVRGKRESGLPEPGQIKATMATNPEFLDRYFPKIAEWMMDDDGKTLGFKDVFNQINEIDESLLSDWRSDILF